MLRLWFQALSLLLLLGMIQQSEPERKPSPGRLAIVLYWFVALLCCLFGEGNLLSAVVIFAVLDVKPTAPAASPRPV